MSRSSTILRELVQSVAEVIFLLKHSVKLRRCILCGDVAVCPEMVCVCVCALCCADCSQNNKHTHTPFHDMLPHLHTIYNDVIVLNVLTEV